MLFPSSRPLAAACVTLTFGAGLLTGCGAESEEAVPEVAPAASCNADVVTAQDKDTRTIETAFGAVKIPAHPRRVVGLEGGAGPVLESGLVPVGIADNSPESFLPGEYQKVKDRPVIQGPDGLDYDKLVELKPDLIIGFVRGGEEEKLSSEKVREWRKLSKIAPTVQFRSNGSAQTKDVSCAIQVTLGRGKEADAAKQAYEDKAAQLRKDYAGVLKGRTFAAIDSYEEVSVYSPISWIGDILTDAGATLVPLAAKVKDQNAAFLSFEQLQQIDAADVVLYSETVDGKPDLGAVDLQKAPTYKELAAVKKGHAFGIRYFFADRYSTALETLKSIEKVLQKLQDSTK